MIAFRLYVIVASAVCIFIVTCIAYETESSSTVVTESSQHVSYTRVRAYTRSSSSGRKKCKRVRRCPINEEFSVCTESLRRAQYCSQRGQTLRQLQNTSYCTEGCVCQENFLRSYTGICVPENECEQECGPGEVLRKCPADCASDYCPTKDGKPPSCKRPEQGQCPPPVCKCAFNHRRATNGMCIPTRDCPPFDCSARPNEEYNSCPPLCPSDDCSQASLSGECPSQFGHILIVLRCNPSCRCIKGYWRKNGICVPYEECNKTTPSIQCSANEELRCVNVCPPEKTCKTRDFEIDCLSSDKPCENKCVCKEGYYRNFLGTCISNAQCNQCSKPNEFYACDSACDNKCSTITYENRTNCPIVNIDCNRQCYCEDGFARDNDGNCVLVDKCPNICPKNEEYNTCTQAVCRQQNCSAKDDSVSCPRIDPDYCKKGCVCKENYYRDENGTCVAEDQCPPKPPPTCTDNEVLDDCPTDCPSDYCPTCEGDNKKCPKPDTCPPPACKCKFNYRRDDNGSCIPTEDCPPFDCSAKPNEQWTPCPPLCPTDSCSLARATGVCPSRIGTRLECNPKCQCKKDYGRTKRGICVPIQDCPNICPINEEYNTCTQAVCRQQNCSAKDDSVSCPRIDPNYCKKGCVCKENYYRDENGTCVAEDQCPPKPEPTCSDNEVLDDCPTDCPSDYCPTCDDDNKQCPKPDTCPPPACKCKFNYRRDENGACIPTEDCPPFDCSAKPNEQWTPCPPLCPTDSCSLARATGVCPFRIGIRLECNPKCQCKKDYGRNEDGTCVPIQDCPDICPINEEYNSCIQAVCRQQNCSTKDDSVSCPRIDPDYCKKGCVCKENYYKNANGDCVPEDQCIDEPPPTCTDNEILDKCPSDCASDYCPNCEDDNKTCPKPENCPPPACKCKFNYRRADNGTCIPTRDCPPFDCNERPHEKYNPCPFLCPTDECSWPWIRKRCPFRIGVRLECRPKCQCKDNYGRLDGTCVPFKDCPDLCPANEEYSSCTQGLCRPQNCSNKYDDEPCPTVKKSSCHKGCVCKENYFRDDDGDCVPEEECPDPRCLNPHEVYKNSLVPNCPAYGTCKSLVARIQCEKPEAPGCVCKTGYLRSFNQTSPCIPQCECKEIVNTPECKSKIKINSNFN